MTEYEFFKKYGKAGVTEYLKQIEHETEFERRLRRLIMSHKVIDNYRYLNLAYEALKRLRDLEKGLMKSESVKGVLLDSEVLEYHIIQVEMCQ